MKSPIKAKPLRYPGQSIGEHISERLDEVMLWIMLPTMLCFLAFMKWFEYFRPNDMSPWVWTSMALVSVIGAGIRLRGYVKEIRNYRQGQTGELAVGQHLESLNSSDAKVFHDIPGDGFNLDHVIICQQGIFVVETKTWSKPEVGDAKILYDGDNLLKNGRPTGNSAINQVNAGASFLKEIFLDSTGRKFEVQAILAFPGWWVDQPNGYHNNTPWVLSAKAIPNFILTQPNQLNSENVHLAKYHLKQHIRNS